MKSTTSANTDRGGLATNSDAQGVNPTKPITTVVPWNRKAKVPPKYLRRLRNKGWWRMVDYTSQRLGKDNIYYRSVAFREAMFAPKGVFVDAGCGESPDALIASYAGYNKVYKIDLFEPEVFDIGPSAHWAKMEKKQGVKFIKGDICERQNIPDNSVDLISCNAMIDLVPEEDRILFYREAYRMLKPGGQLSVCVVLLKNGYYTDGSIERDKCTMPDWGIGFELDRNYPSGFIVQKPDTSVTTAAKKGDKPK